tara:strand:+ start:189 stop:1283 length:1095 start_codon:yes stop_codon:yes gene_type:complete
MARVARKILHLDMDAFYASVEQRDKPELRGRPVIVGGSPQSRGVVCTASYEARTFGVRSAMSCAEAYRRCPQGVFVRPDMERYAAVSRQIQGIFGEYADAVEPLSYDEAYLDVTSDLRGLGSATATAEAIRREVKEATGLTVSAGVAPNKFLAKVASDLDKPDGLVVVPPARVPELLATLPVRAIPGIGKVTAERCKRLGIVSAVDFLRHDEGQLSEWFGVYGLTLREFARGEDHRPVRVSRGRKQVSVEDTFAEDLIGLGPGRRELERLTAVLAGRLEKKGLRGSTVTVKVTYSDFTRASRRRTLGLPVSSAAELYEIAADLLRETEIKERPVRLLGVGLGKLEGAKRQLLFPFLDEPATPSP